MKLFRILVLIILMLVFGRYLPVLAAQKSVISEETCETQPAAGWRRNGNVTTADGICILNDGQIVTEERLLDFSLHFRFRLEKDSKMLLKVSKSVWEWYEVSISPQEAILTHFLGNNRSMLVSDTQMRKAKVNIPAATWVDGEIRMGEHKQTLTIDGAEIWAEDFPRLETTISIGGYFDAQVDNMLVEEQDFSVSGQSLASFSTELSNTWIAYMSLTGDSLWIIHPDGTGKTQIAIEAEPNWGIQYKFSPDGQFLGILRVGQQQGEISFLDLNTLQLVGEPVVTSSEAQFDWLSNSQQVVILNSGEVGNEFLITEIQTGNILRKVPIPTSTREGELQINFVKYPECSPSEDVLLLYVIGDPQGSTFSHVLFDLNTETTDLLPWGGEFSWSPDGNYLFAGAGGLIEKNSLNFTDLPKKLIDASNSWKALWSPNGQFIAGRSGEATQTIIDLDSEQVKSLPASSFGNWSPDSHHFVFADTGRIIVMNGIDTANQQIVQGTNPSWQPDPNFPSQSEHISLEPTASPTERNLSEDESQEQILQTQPPVTQMPEVATQSLEGDLVIPSEQGNGREQGNLLLIILLVIGFAGIVASIIWYFLHSRITCKNCYGSNPSGSIFCMNCGSALPKHQKRIMPAWVGLGISLLFLLLGALGILSGRGEKQAGITETQKVDIQNQATIETSVPERATVIGSEESDSDSTVSQSYICEELDLRSINLRQLLQDNQISGQKLAAAFDELSVLAQTPTPDSLRVTQVADAMKPYCGIMNISFSPDGTKILLRLTENQGKKVALFSAQDGRFLWAISIQEAVTWEQWSHDSSKILLSTDQGNYVLESASGKEESSIPTSARRGASCELMSFSGATHSENISWVKDTPRLLRKIDNAVQILDSSNAEILQEVHVDDNKLGTYPTEGVMSCRYSLIWSPDGDSFATVGYYPLQHQNQLPIYVIRAWQTEDASMIWEAMVPGSTYGASAAWSPDGKWILFSNYLESQPLTLLNARNGENVSVITLPPEAESSSRYTWAPDSRRIVYLSKSTVYWYDLTSKNWNQSDLPENAQGGQINSWIPPDGKILVRANRLITEYWVLDLSSRSWTPLQESPSAGP